MESIKWRISVFSPASWPHEHMLDLRKGSDDHKSSVFLKKGEKFWISFGFQIWKDLVRENSLDYGCEYFLFFLKLCILPLSQSKFKNGRNEQTEIKFKISNIHSYFMTNESTCSLTTGCSVCLCLPSFDRVCGCTYFVMSGRERKTQEAAIPQNRKNTYSEMAWADVMKMRECKYKLFSCQHPGPCEKWCSFPQTFLWSNLQ